MNSRERTLRALELKEPDRVPVIEMEINKKVYQAIYPEVNNIQTFAKKMGLDAIPYNYNYEIIEEKNKDKYVDEWGITWEKSPETVDYPVNSPIKNLNDLKNYSPPEPDSSRYSPRFQALEEIASKHSQSHAILSHSRTSFAWATELAGFDNLLKAFVINPEFTGHLLDTVLDVTLRMTEKMIEAGADIIFLGDGYAGNKGPFMSPRHFREFIKPRLTEMVQLCHDKGAYVIKHTDGDVGPIMEDLVDTGIDALNPIDPVAGMDIGEIRAEFGDRVALLGNIDCINTLPSGTKEEVKREVKQYIKDASVGGGHLVSSSNSIHSEVDPDNYLAMVEAVKEFGNYPIRLS